MFRTTVVSARQGGKGKTKGASLADSAFYPYRSTMSFHDVFRNAEPQAHAVHLFPGPDGSIILVKHQRLFFFRDSGTGVRDRKIEFEAVC